MYDFSGHVSRSVSRRSFVGAAASALSLAALAACAPPAEGQSSTQAADTHPIQRGSDGTWVLKAVADITPHAEILAYAEPAFEAAGVKVDVVSTAPDQTTNTKTEDGEIDFNYDQHVPYLEEWNEKNNGDLVSAGDIHVEPITAYSDTYSSVDQLPDDATIGLPNDATNEYRALKILEDQGFITLSDSAKSNLASSKEDVTAYLKPIQIVELDSAQIIPSRASFDVFITNTNKFLESGITSAKLFSEGPDSPYANVIVTRPENKDNEAIQKIVQVLRSDDVKRFVLDTYQGAVIPAQ